MDWLNQGLHYLQLMTVSGIVSVGVVFFFIGKVLQSLVRSGVMLAQSAVYSISFLATIFGMMTGSIAMMIGLILFWPDSAEWIVNTYLSKTTIWQIQFQQWITAQISESRTATGVGLLISKLSIGSMVLGALFTKAWEWAYGKLMRRDYHDERCVLERVSRLDLARK